MLGLLDLQLLTDLHAVRVHASIEILESLERDADLLGDAAEGVALGDDVFAGAGGSGGLTAGGSLRGRSNLLESDDLVGEGLVEGRSEVVGVFDLDGLRLSFQLTSRRQRIVSSPFFISLL